MKNRFRMSAAVCSAILMLWAAIAFGQAANFHQLDTARAEIFDDGNGTQNDIQFQSDRLHATTGGDCEIDHTDKLDDSCPDNGLKFDELPRNVGPVSLSGNLDSGGVMFNGHHPKSHFNGPVTFTDRDNGQFDQMYMVSGSGAGERDVGWCVGSRVDLMFGNDYYFMTSAGLDGTTHGNRARWYTDDSFRYGWAMPQLFVDVGHYDLDIKIGHFYAPIGYEVAPAGDNFFVTRSYAFQYGEPTTQTGVLVSNPLNDFWSFTTGLVGGWNTFDADTRPAFIGGVSYSVENRGRVEFTLIAGDDSTINQPGIGPFANRTMYSLVWTANLSSSLTYVLQHDLGIQQHAATLQGIDRAEWYGINQYLFYNLRDCLSVGARFEWFRDDDGFNVTGLRPENPLIGNFFAGNFYEMAIGLNYQPFSGLTIRPEVRYDWFHPSSGIGSQNPFDDNTSKNQILFGLDAILHY